MKIAKNPSAAQQDLDPLPLDCDALIPANRLPRHIGIAEQTLARWRHEGQGPKFVKVGRRVAYRSGDVRAWLRDRTYAHTTEATVAHLAA